MHQHSTPDPRAESGAAPDGFAFCPRCGEGLTTRVVGGKERPSCEECGFVHFRNPGVGAAVVMRVAAERILLVRRGPTATRAGLWSIPAGYVDYGEEVRAAAARELREETGLEATIGAPVWVVMAPQAGATALPKLATKLTPNSSRWF